MRSASVMIGLVAVCVLATHPSSTGAQTQAGRAATFRIADRSGLRISSWRNHGIDHHNQLLLVRAAMEGKPDGIVLFATEMGATDRVIRDVAASGGELMTRFDDVGYFRARLPLKQFMKAAALPGVLLAIIDGGALEYGRAESVVNYPVPKKSKADSLKADSIAKDSTRKDSVRVAALPLIPDAARAGSPYLAMNEMRAYDLRKMDARFDGRGFTVAVLEGGLYDVLHPALQHALSADGQKIQKLRAVISAHGYDPDIVQPDLLVGSGNYTNFDNRRVRRTQSVAVTSGTFVVDDSTFRAPNGTYSFGKYTRGKTCHAVLWDDARRLIWVDANGNKDLTDEEPLKDINSSFSVGVMRALDSTAKDPKRSVRFAVTFDSIPNTVRVYEAIAGHQTMVSTVAVGNGILGVADASAPGAQLVIVDT